MGLYGGYKFSYIQEVKNRFIARAVFVYRNTTFTTYGDDGRDEEKRRYICKILNLADAFDFLYIENNKVFCNLGRINIDLNLALLFIKTVNSKFNPIKFIGL